MAEVHGTCEPRFDAVRATLADQIDSGADIGASVAVFLHGEPVVDIWGGWSDEAKTRPWERDTLTNVWSTTKTMTFLVALMLHDRGELDFHAPVSTYWPEFAAAGKESIEVRHIMGHTSGLSGWEEPLASEDLANWDLCTSRLAAQAPWWEPGTGSGYHALTQGYLIGEIVRRITGESIGSFFAREVAKPLDADFFIGLPPSEDHRVSNVIPPPPIDVAAMEGQVSELMMKTFMNPPIDATNAHQEWWRRAEIPAANGQGNAALGGRHPIDHRRTGRSPWCPAAVGCRYRPDLRGAGGGRGQGAGRAPAHGDGLRPEQSARDATRPARLLLGRLRRVGHHHGSGRRARRLLRDEPHGVGSRR